MHITPLSVNKSYLLGETPQIRVHHLSDAKCNFTKAFHAKVWLMINGSVRDSEEKERVQNG
jgi:hypothetical protein